MKYGNKSKNVDGVSFQSTGEADRWSELLLLEKAKKIRNLQRQVRYRLVVNGELICVYVADFVYDEGARTIVEDFKSIATMTPTFNIKKKLMKACLGIDIRIMMKGGEYKRKISSRRLRR
jgi:hypothetical protein